MPDGGTAAREDEVGLLGLPLSTLVYLNHEKDLVLGQYLELHSFAYLLIFCRMHKL